MKSAIRLIKEAMALQGDDNQDIHIVIETIQYRNNNYNYTEEELYKAYDNQ